MRSNAAAAVYLAAFTVLLLLHAAFGELADAAENKAVQAMEQQEEYPPEVTTPSPTSISTPSPMSTPTPTPLPTSTPTPVPTPTASPTSEPTPEQQPVESYTDCLAKLLYCEGGGAGWECQRWICSAIVNYLTYSGMDIWTAMHDANIYEVAPYVDDCVPTQTQYDVITYVLNGGRVPLVTYFRTEHPHDFGVFVSEVEGVYFSAPSLEWE